ncbi:cytochrome P450 2F2-like isoform X2 [Alosa pseudoharengus]|uniref:cytochrome P450 2F2-like isoform X2 n=1 Tax=Alosa pseudoharengus TaxID=34774 RepID=UPI003F8C9B30
MVGAMIVLWLSVCLLLWLLMGSRPQGFPPGPAPLPLIGNLLQLDPQNPLKTLSKLAQRYGPVFSLYIGTRPVVVLNGQQALREALVTKAVEFTGRPDHIMISHMTEGKGVILADVGPSWREHRRFALSTLRNFGLGKRSMEQRILEELTHVCALLEKSAGGSMDPQHLFHHAASNIICSIIFGSRFDYDDHYFQTLITMMEEINKLAIGPWAMLYDVAPVLRALPLPFRKVFRYYQRLREHMQKVITQHQHQSAAHTHEPRDMIDCYLQEMQKRAGDGSSFDDSHMESLLIDLFVAGTDTTSNTLRTACLYLMTHTHVQEQCHQEIDAMLGCRECVSFDDRHTMPYVQAVIHESQRVGNVVPLSVFHTATTHTQLHGYTIPKGTMVIPNLSSVLSEEGQWKFPHEFNPHNFLNEHGEFVKPDAFLPFSAGSRVCLGESLARMELFLILVTVLRRFQLVWPDDGGVPDYELIFGATQSPKPYRMGVRLRPQVGN